MAYNEMCNICCENFNKNTRMKVTCPRADCNWEACKTCVRTFIMNSSTDPSCMKCFNALDIQFVVENLNKSFWNGDYKTHRKEMLLENEMSKMPDTMNAATKYKEILHLKETNLENVKQIISLRQQIDELHRTNYRNDRRIRRLYVAINTNTELDEDSDSASKKFIMKCSYENCRGYLSTQYKCNICEQYTCSKCLEKVGKYSDLQEHVCDPNNIKTANMIKKDTKPCPNCGERIYKIDGCDQMFCTVCHTAFSWKTGLIVTGVIHNPHFYEWQRQNAGNNPVPRVPGDVVCGGLIDFVELRSILRKLFPKLNNPSNYCQIQITESTDPEIKRAYNLKRKINCLHRLIAHVTHVSIVDLNNKIDQENTHLYKRIDYILNIISKDELQDFVYKQNIIRAKSTEIRNIWQSFQVAGIEFFNNLREISKAKVNYNNIEDQISQIVNFSIYCNHEFAKVSITYNNQVVPKISNNFYENSTKYKKSKITDGSGGGGSSIIEY